MSIGGKVCFHLLILKKMKKIPIRLSATLPGYSFIPTDEDRVADFHSL
ncbi:hypothetical protein LEP1GSC103_0387 [Leptospira borgpetersenii serovar Javanica str. UI 09931]|uniref:Uncharacterized protein n=4 Tax=Leptospira borgpetersenii TaxID=174 RepID=M3HNS6_LEPBO|nr:hypothetical protein LBBP_03214 [Leptospira borgpetersenii serovar Ballum]EKP14715.1 hypothetical protein LEP1GSC128_1562 [Leptospira borgpetersenii str. 200801926]EKQ99829.1 hypothetical protein LEP1GSC121_2085 [Leptospira borgpetersenii serovar Castellonis str. 200801910]EMF99730.1 hypothetical protein LEP1GSC123_2647 [Leptospira borgpetersenii str. 200701203]EMK12383.1 hypothetical protein LEP1GSC066_3314 [Leptospira sp. serovar Kenya str. Sh9]EMN58102.1 hypothetical protein LEP1GSC090_3